MRSGRIRTSLGFAKYPPTGRRSQGNGQYGALWGGDYRATANDNIMIVAMIENPAGVEIVDRRAHQSRHQPVGNGSRVKETEPGT